VKIPIIDNSHTPTHKKKCPRGQRSSHTQKTSEAQQHKRLKGNDLFRKHLIGKLHSNNSNNNILLATENIIKKSDSM
jgi:hypothetical protein